MTKTSVNKTLHNWGILLIFLAVLCIGGAAVPLTRLPDISQQLNAKSGQITITIIKPANSTVWYLNSSIKVFANVVSARPIQSLELWVDGTIITPSTQQKGDFGSWVWVVQKPGEHTLIVRGKDSAGGVSDSNVVRIVGLTSSLPGMQLVYPSQPGDTVQSIANKYRVPAGKITDANTKLAGNASIPPGSLVKVPIDFPQPTAAPEIPPTPAPPGPSQSPSSNKPNKFVFWISQFLENNPPTAPDIALAGNGCSVNLLITDHSSNELGFNIYRLDPTSLSFKKIDTLGASGNSGTPIQYTDANLYGTFSYYVSSFNGQGESPSNIAVTNISGGVCFTPYWAGAQPSSPLPLLPSSIHPPLPLLQKYDKAYYYLSINGGGHQRVPSDPNQFLTLPGGVFNVDDQLKTIVPAQGQGPLTVDLDAWGWNGGTLTHIGDFKNTIVPPQNSPSITTPGLLQVCQNPPCLDTPGLGGDFVDHTMMYQYTSILFRWNANSQDVTGGLVQVSTSPFDQTCNANPSGLVWTVTIPFSGSGFSSFNVDFAPLHISSPDAIAFYIRVLPQANGQTVCEPSNSVFWTYQVYIPTIYPTAKPTLSPAPPPPNPYSVSVVQFKPIQYPDYQWQYCVVVVANPCYNNSDPVCATGLNADWTTIPVGSWVCPHPHSGGYVPPEQSAWDQITSWIGSGLNAISDAYNSLKSFVVDLAADLNPLCIQAKIGADAIGQGKTTVDDVCHAVAEATVDIAAAYVGLPPSLPDYSQVVGASKGYLVDAAAQELEDQTGIPCDSACKQVLSTAVDQTSAKISLAQDNSSCVDVVTAEDNGYEPFCTPPGAGVQTVPDPRGQLLPAFAEIQITRDPNIPDTAFPDPSQFQTQCSWGVSVTGTNDSLVGQQVELTTDVHTGQLVYWPGQSLSGDLFKGVQGSIPDIAPGDSITIPMTLDPKSADYPSTAGFWILEHKQLLDDKQQVEQTVVHASDDWSKLYLGALATVNASTRCTTTAAGMQGSNSPGNKATLQVQIPNLK